MYTNTSNKTKASDADNAFGSILERLTTELRNLPSSQRFTNDELEYIYTIGHAYYQQSQFEKARDFFSFLRIYSPVNLRYLKALAAAQQMCGQLQDAIDTYSFLIVLDENDPEIIERRNNCKLALS